MKKIAIIIVAYNSLNIIKDCIDSIFRYNDLGYEDIEIIVVENSACEVADKMSRHLIELYGEKIRLIKNKQNLGYGQGNNLGIKNVTGEIICIMNPDVRLKEPIFSQTIAEFENNNNLGLLGYKQISGYNLSFYLKPEYHLLFLSSLIIKLTNKINYFNPKYFYLSGALFFTDRVKFDKIGKFDENFFMQLEEADISNRLLENKYEIKFNKNYEYFHLMSDRHIYSEFTFNNLLVSARYYLKKYHLKEQKYFKVLKTDLLLKILISRLIFDKKREIKFRKEYDYLVAFLKKIF